MNEPHKDNMVTNILPFIVLFNLIYSKPLPITSGVRMAANIPVETTKGRYMISNDYDVYYSENLTMYRITVQFDSSVNGKSLLTDNRDRYFVFSNDSSFGLTFDDRVERGQQVLPRRQSVDSIRKKNNTVFTTFESGRKPDSSFEDAGELINVFQFKKTAQFPEDFRFLFYYSDAFKDISETFTKAFDTVGGLKLHKIVIKASGGYHKEFKASLAPREYLYAMKKVSLNDIRTADAYFEKYRTYYRL